jgi:hypothetical protein
MCVSLKPRFQKGKDTVRGHCYTEYSTTTTFPTTFSTAGPKIRSALFPPRQKRKRARGRRPQDFRLACPFARRCTLPQRTAAVRHSAPREEERRFPLPGVRFIMACSHGTLNQDLRFAGPCRIEMRAVRECRHGSAAGTEKSSVRRRDQKGAEPRAGVQIPERGPGSCGRHRTGLLGTKPSLLSGGRGHNKLRPKSVLPRYFSPRI